MSHFKLFKQRTVWLPTIWGCLLIIGLLLLSSGLIISQLAYWLAPTRPVPDDRQYLIVEGWQSQHSLLKALHIFEQEGYRYLITTGGPDHSQVTPLYNNYAEQAAAFLLEVGLPASQLIVIPAPASAQNRTYLSAVMVRDWLAQQAVEVSQLNVHTSDVHARRTRSLYQRAFDGVQIGIYAAPPTEFSLEQWWQTSTGAKSVLIELIGNFHVWCCFNPGPRGSHYEKWAVEPRNPANPIAD